MRGWRLPFLSPRVATLAARLASAAQRAWALCLARVFAVYPLICSACGVEMEPVAAITADAELTRLLSHLGLQADFPINKPARSPPLPLERKDFQVDPVVYRWECVDPQAWGDSP